VLRSFADHKIVTRRSLAFHRRYAGWSPFNHHGTQIMLHTTERSALVRRPRLSVQVTNDAELIIAAQALRYRVFADEMGATLRSPEAGLDIDPFDVFCEHLIVQDEEIGEVVGTYRILSPKRAAEFGMYYSETEFDLSPLQALRSSLVEVGRACVHRDYRSGAVIALLWSGLANYMQQHGYDYFMGCASIEMHHDGGVNAAAVWREIAATSSAPEQWRVRPLNPLPVEQLDQGKRATIPPLLRAYLRAGAQVCARPAWDPDFNTADLLVLLPMRRLDAKFARHFAAA
jgi:putative hemolysin